MKFFTLIFVLTFSVICNAQDKSLYERQKAVDQSKNIEVIKINSPSSAEHKKVLNPVTFENEAGLIDTLSYIRSFQGFNFGFFGQDWILQWFRAPANLTIKAIGFYCYENNYSIPVEAKIVKLNWGYDSLLNAQILRRGYYQALGNGYNDITAFLDNPDRTGDWTSIQPGDTEPFSNDMWSDNGVGYSFIPDPTIGDIQWISTSVLGNEPFVQCGEIFGIALKNTSTRMDSDRVGFFANVLANNYPIWKFYANGRLDPGQDYGWWTREYTFNFQVIVESDGWVNIADYTQLPIVVGTEPVDVEATVFGSEPPEIIYDVKVHYTTDHGAGWKESSLSYIGNHKYSGEIPGHPPGTIIDYYFDANDTAHLFECSYYDKTFTHYYSTPMISNATLTIYNGFSSINGFPQDYYFGKEVNNGIICFANDEWAYGQVDLFLLEYYQQIIEITSQTPEYSTAEVVKQWLNENGNRNYLLVGQNILNTPTNGTNYEQGEFEYDVLGISKPYFDVSYNSNGDQYLPSKLLPEDNTQFGEPLLNLFNSLNPPADSMMYNPNFMLSYPNWIDAFDVLNDVTVDMNVETRSLDGVTNAGLKPVMIHRTLSAGNKIVFASLDPLAITSAVDSSFAYYYWIGFDSSNVVFQSLRWFGVDFITDVDNNDQNALPKGFNLLQNFPNPFNPSTTIKYAIPNITLSPDKNGINSIERSRVILKVYDILGKEIVTLVNEEQPAGNYEVEFNVVRDSRPAIVSGVYFYRLQAGDFIETKKMLLLK